jgi:hypothetical protein
MRDFLTGGTKVTEAEETIKSLEKKKRLKKRDIESLSKARSVIASHTRKKIGLMVGGSLAALLSLASLKTCTNDDSSEQAVPDDEPTSASSSPSLSEEQEMDRFIGEAENGFMQFGALVEPLIQQQTHLSELQRAELSAPFEAMRINFTNAERNADRFHSVRQGEGIARLANPYHFTIDVMDEEGILASFAPTTRVMSLSSDFDPSSILDNLVLYHELRHSTEDANLKQSFRTQEQYNSYLAFNTRNSQTDRPRMMIASEGQAYAYEIEILNLLLDGQLKRDIEAGNNVTNDQYVNQISSSIGVNDVQGRRVIQMLLTFADKFYPEGFSERGGMPREYIDLLADQYRAQGYDLYLGSPGYEVIPFE